MHFSMVVGIPASTAPEREEEVIAQLLAPFNEQSHYDTEEDDGEGGTYPVNSRSFWDWWQIGGRWTGYFAPSYDPEKDPHNQELCCLCAGTGVRPGGLEQFGQEWYEACNGCNSCQGTGTSVKWPTEWRQAEGNRATQAEALEFFTWVVTTEPVEGSPHLPHLPYRVLVGEVLMVKESYEPDNPQGERFVQDEGYEKHVLELVASAMDTNFVIVDYHN